ncbi:SprT-like domain-containing protein [Clostridium sp.]|uniref:SprT-like domain-containing protein n=1 Tax=Clostridium sp. TaxID=1506 RepID=UPI002FCAE882
MINFKSNRNDEIGNKRRIIKEEFSKICVKSMGVDTEVVTLQSMDVEKLFYLYDKYFFYGQLRLCLDKTIKFSVSTRMTSAGGKTIYKKTSTGKEYEIRISLVVLNNFYLNSNEKKVSGLVVSSDIEALQIILEHEICHVLEFHNYGISSCKGLRFKKMSSEIFGHKSIYHEIPSRSTLKYKDKKPSISIGDKVIFEHKNKEYKGLVTNITKRATVMVLDIRGRYQDKDGKRYTKWYVPIINLCKDGRS